MKRDDSLILQDLRSILSQLSPENLAQDGLRSRGEQRRVELQLRARMGRLHAELGRVPTDDELYQMDTDVTPAGQRLLEKLFGRCGR